MNVLQRCHKLNGNATIINADPQLSVYRNLAYFPDVWGLYDQGQKLVTSTGFFRGPGAPEPIAATFSRDFSTRDIIEEAPDTCYYFFGHMPSHYGHFLLCAMSRLWAYAAAGQGLNLIAYGNIDHILDSNPAIVELLNAFGLGARNFVTFDKPTRIRQIMVAAPSFEETNYIHSVFPRMCRGLAEKLTDGLPSDPSSTPIYLAKYKLQFGVVKLANEEVIADRFERRGVEVVFPEQLSVGQQIQLWRDRQSIAGLIGSAFHTGAFVGQRKLLMLNYGFDLLSNQVMLDRAVPHDALYLYSTLGFKDLDRHDGFGSIRMLTDPARVADDLLKIFDPFMKIKSTGSAEDQEQEGCFAMGTNLAYHRLARQSSTSRESIGLSTSDNAAGAVSGFLTAGFQFHTAHEPEPWWDVDLGSVREFDEIRIFNRSDQVSERAARFAISTSSDSATWNEVFRREVWTTWGSTSGVPLIWQSQQPILSRFIRITLLSPNFLHLDQVAVFSRATPQPMTADPSRIYLMTRFGQLVCTASRTGVIARDPLEISSIDELVPFDIDTSLYAGWIRQIVGAASIEHGISIRDGALAGGILHLLNDPLTLAFSRDGLFLAANPDIPDLVCDRPLMSEWETYQRLDRDQVLALIRS